MNESFIVEAEWMSLDNYQIEPSSSASGGELISLSDESVEQTGSASFFIANENMAGEYKIVVAYRDENDGVSSLAIEQNDSLIDSWNCGCDLPSAAPDETTELVRTVTNITTIAEGDRFTIRGTKNGGEGAVVDYVQFIPASSSQPSTLELEDNIFEVNEDANTVEIPLIRRGNLNDIISVDYQTFEETAIAGADFVSQQATLTFEPGESQKNIVIDIIDDEATDADETFSLSIDGITGNGTLFAPRTARITIEDNETPEQPVFVKDTGIDTEVTEGGDNDSYTIALGNQPSSEVTVDIITDEQIDTNVATLTFSPENWNQPQEVIVSATEDDLQEGDREAIIRHSVSSSDVNFDGFALEDIIVNTIDNDIGDFTVETFASGFDLPVAIDWTPDGDKAFVAQLNGVVRLIENGTLAETPFIDISPQVNRSTDRGLLGLAVHPDFPNQPYVYLAFTYDPPEAMENNGLGGEDGNGNRPSRVIRVEADPNTNFTTAIPGSEVVIVGINSTWENTSCPDANSTDNFNIPPSGITPDGENIRDYLATDSQSHSIGALRFGTDGSLFISNGDGTSYNRVDPRSVRVQDIDNLSGKLLRVDPLTGEGLSDNPFYNGDPNSNRSKVYSYGLRNPFRFAVNPETNEPFVGDVGWKTWEEINTGRGGNFGWPFYEGGDGTSLQQPEYQNLPEAQAFYNSGESVIAPISADNHEDGAVAITMGDFYTGDTYPDFYKNALFYSDFRNGSVNYLTSNEDGVSVNTFDEDISGLTQISTGADGNLYGVDLFFSRIIRWRLNPS